MGQQVGDAAGVDDLAAVLTGAGPDVDHPVGHADRVLVVLDDDQGVAELLEAHEGLDQPVVVALVEADGRLVEDVEDADETGADLGREPDPLGLAARQRAGRPVEAEVVEADVEQEVEALEDLLEHPLADLLLAGGQVECAEELGGLVDRQRADLGDRAVADGHGDRDRLEPRALAGGARHLAHEALEALTAGVGLGLAVAPLDVGLDALELGVVGAFAAVAVAGDDVDLRRVAPQQRLLLLGGEVGPGGVEVEAELGAERLHQPLEVVGDVGLAPGLDRPLTERGRGVRDDQLGVDLEPGAEAVALRARSERAVEGERARLELVGVDGVVVGARHLLREPQLTPRVLRVEVDEVEDHETAGEVEGGLHRVGEPSLGRLLDREPVDDDLDGVLLLLVERRRVVEGVRLAVDAGTGEALGLQLLEELDVLALAAADHRREHLEAAAPLEGEHPVDDLLGRLALDRRAAGRAVGVADAGEQQAEVVVDLGDRADGRARVLRGRLLVDRHRGREALDEVDVGLVHLAEELARVGRQRLDVAALALGEDRVERQARLPGAGEPREDDEGVAGQVEGDVLEVVLPGTPDDELVGHSGPVRRTSCRRVVEHMFVRRRAWHKPARRPPQPTGGQ